MMTKGEIEALVCEGLGHFEQEYMGRGPKEIRAHLLDDLLVAARDGLSEDAKKIAHSSLWFLRTERVDPN